MKGARIALTAILLYISPITLLADDKPAEVQPHAIVRAISWTTDALITKPLAILGSIGKLRFRVWVQTKRPDGSTEFALVDFDTRDVAQREADK